MRPKIGWSALAVPCFAVVASLTLAGGLRAATIVPPRDLGELARRSDAVVLARALDARGESLGALPHTVTRFELLRQVSGLAPGTIGAVGAHFEVAEPGGTVGEVTALVPGAPVYRAGTTYLLFLDRAPDGRWRSQVLSYGLLEEVPEAGLLRPLPEALEVGAAGITSPGTAAGAVEPVGTYRKEALLAHLAELALGGVWDRRRVLAPAAADAADDGLEVVFDPQLQAAFDKVQTNQPAACLYLGQAPGTKVGTPFRWRFENAVTATVFAATPGQTGFGDGGISSIQQATAAWTNHPDSVINFTYGGTVAQNVSCTGNAFPDTQAGAAIWNDPCSDIADLAGCSGTLALGGTFSSGTHAWDGDTWSSASSPFVIVNNGAQCIGATAFAEMMTHELGHSLGFGHHTAAAAPNNPTMSGTLKNDGRGAALVAADKTCASFAYHTFKDVPLSYWAWPWVEAIENAGVTSGCGSGNYCPASLVSREQMAVFLLRAEEGPAYTPPACLVPTFLDVPCASSTAPWINELAVRGVTGGCGAGNFCPAGLVNRGQMAVFLLATVEGPGYAPPACVTPVFADVPCSNPFAAWINELADRGITGGCGGGNYCPGNAVSRASMAVFLSATFGLPVP
jgi:S-layer homology domain